MNSDSFPARNARLNGICKPGLLLQILKTVGLAREFLSAADDDDSGDYEKHAQNLGSRDRLMENESAKNKNQHKRQAHERISEAQLQLCHRRHPTNACQKSCE